VIGEENEAKKSKKSIEPRNATKDALESKKTKKNPE